MSQWVNGSVDGSMGRMGQLMGQWVGWVLGQWVNGSWVSDTMGQIGHGSPMVTHGPPWSMVWSMNSSVRSSRFYVLLS